MNSSRTRPGSARRPVGEAPVEKLVTEAELRVKQLLEAQMESSVTVTSLQARYKQFAPAVLYDPQLAAISGTKSLSSYSTAVDGDQQIDELRQLGLSEDDIRVMLAGDLSEAAGAGYTGRHLLNPDVMREQRERIRKHVASRSRSLLEDTCSSSSLAAFSGATTVSRHTLQLERALGRGTRLATMTECLLREKQQLQSTSVSGGSERSCSPPAGNNETSGPIPSSTLTHPADLLRQIADELSSSGNRNSCSRRKRRRKSPTKQCDADKCDRTSPVVDGRRQTRCERVDGEQANECLSPTLATSVQSDSRISPSESLLEGSTSPQMTSPEHRARRPAPAAYIYGPSERVGNSDVVDSATEVEQTQGLVSVCGPIWLIADEEIARNRLSVSELRALPHFACYEPGTPNNVLYVKNLASSVRELDLVSLFNRFNCPTKSQILYRLLVGRMKGQAFVTFPDVETATLALHTLNGYMFRGKPVVLSYGRKTSENALLSPDHLSVAPSQEPAD